MLRPLLRMLLLLLPALLLIGGSWAAAAATPSTSTNQRQRRGLDLSSVHHLIPDQRLKSGLFPLHYELDLHPMLEDNSFSGVVRIDLYVVSATRDTIELHAHYDLTIKLEDISLREKNGTKTFEILRASRLPKKTIYVMRLKEPLPPNRTYLLTIRFSGAIWDTAVGMFRGQYADIAGEKRTYLATHLRPNSARRLFPCFDEPQYKTPFNVSVARPRTHHTLFNTRLSDTRDVDAELAATLAVRSDNANVQAALRRYVIDRFDVTAPMATFELGFVMSSLPELNGGVNVEPTPPNQPQIRIWARPEFHGELESLRTRLLEILTVVREYLDQPYPLPKLDVVALPGFSALKPIDNWGLLVFKESDLATGGYYMLAQELIYQWLGNWVSPMWWADSHINKAVVGLLAAQTTLTINNGAEFDGKWPMTQLYSIYYEFSKRYPHSRITGLKQETTCSKTELVLRMLNYTLGADAFRDAMRELFKERFDTNDLAHAGLGWLRGGYYLESNFPPGIDHGRHFYGEDVWRQLTAAAHRARTLPASMSISTVAESWITKDRLPVVTVRRDYEAGTAVATQKVYLRERPHDVPEQAKMLWYIPLVVVVQEERMDFGAYEPRVWLHKTREVQMGGMPAADRFVIVNPEEIGPFPVNYDERNWNLLAAYLQTAEGRKAIPMNTRAKLLHDAWNLAYAGDLSFATAFNMTLFMRYEREHVVWNPVFTLIDHIGNHIDMSTVHKKFETYVRMLLTPLYEELGPVVVEGEEKWKDNLRTLARLFLCRAGYRPCVEEAQAAYAGWMRSERPDEGNPVANQYICPVFKWGTQSEWEFGLQRVIHFPAHRKQSERTYLLKCLVGCPAQAAKIERLLRLTILEANGNFTENDIFLEFNMLSSGSSGYTSLFNFLSDNWAEIRARFASRTNLWDNLISSATGAFTTQAGYDMVAKLHADRRGEFGSAEHIIEKSLRNIKEETKWSAENLPVIEQWLDEYLATVAPGDDPMFLG